MITLLQAFNPVASRMAGAAAGAVIAGLWQGVVLAGATWVVLRFVPKTPAWVRFVVWIAVFFVAAALPLVHFYDGAVLDTVGPVARIQVDARWSYLVAALWVGALLIRLGMLTVEAAGLRRLWKSAVTIEGTAFANLMAGRKVQVCTSNRIDRPSVIGFFAPRILIPEWLFAQLTETELNHIVLHEMEHLRRGDDWANLLQKVGLVLFPLNPALFWIDRRLSVEREIACDDGVLERTKTPKAYAESLTSIAGRQLGMRLNRRVVALALGAIGVRPQSEFGRRIESILARRAAMKPALAGGLAAMLLLGLGGAGLEMSRAPGLISFAGETPLVAVASVAAAEEIGQSTVTKPLGPRAGFESVSYRVPAPVSRQVARSKKTTGIRKTSVPVDSQCAAISPTHSGTSAGVSRMKHQGQLMVLTTWEQSAGEPSDLDQVPVSRVVMKMPDGRFVVAPYAAVPTQAGWLIIQL